VALNAGRGAKARRARPRAERRRLSLCWCVNSGIEIPVLLPAMGHVSNTHCRGYRGQPMFQDAIHVPAIETA